MKKSCCRAQITTNPDHNEPRSQRTQITTNIVCLLKRPAFISIVNHCPRFFVCCWIAALLNCPIFQKSKTFPWCLCNSASYSLTTQNHLSNPYESPKGSNVRQTGLYQSLTRQHVIWIGIMGIAASFIITGSRQWLFEQPLRANTWEMPVTVIDGLAGLSFWFGVISLNTYHWFPRSISKVSSRLNDETNHDESAGV